MPKNFGFRGISMNNGYNETTDKALARLNSLVRNQSVSDLLNQLVNHNVTLGQTQEGREIHALIRTVRQNIGALREKLDHVREEATHVEANPRSKHQDAEDLQARRPVPPRANLDPRPRRRRASILPGTDGLKAVLRKIFVNQDPPANEGTN